MHPTKSNERAPSAEKTSIRLARFTLDGHRTDYSFSRLPIVLGREDGADLPLPSRWASRNHCRIDSVDGQLMVRDLNSKNGTFVNGRKLAEAPLKSGDKITVVDTTIELLDSECQETL